MITKDNSKIIEQNHPYTNDATISNGISPAKFNPYSKAPLSSTERFFFNVSCVYLTLVSSSIFALLMATMPSFTAAFIGLVWALPGIIVLNGYYRARAKRKVRSLHTSIFIAEILFLLFSVYMIVVAIMSKNFVGLCVDIVLFMLYIAALEFGLLRIVKKHEEAFYNETLKDKLSY